jgi:hypothetical protein
MKIYTDFIQGSEAWFSARKGRPTASQFSKIITAVKGDLSKSHTSYIVELIAECFCPTYAAWIGNSWTDRGNDLEPEARTAFTAHTGLEVEQVGFCTRDDGIVGASPDGLIRGPDGEWLSGLELKAPAPKTHVEYVLDGVLPDTYKQQVHGGMAVTGLSRWEFFSYYPGMQPFHITVYRDDYTEKLSAALDEFLLKYRDAREKAVPRLQIRD